MTYPPQPTNYPPPPPRRSWSSTTGGALTIIAIALAAVCVIGVVASQLDDDDRQPRNASPARTTAATTAPPVDPRFPTTREGFIALLRTQDWWAEFSDDDLVTLGEGNCGLLTEHGVEQVLADIEEQSVDVVAQVAMLTGAVGYLCPEHRDEVETALTS